MMRSPEQQFALAKSLPIPELAKVLQGQSDVVDMAIAQMVLRQKVQTQTAQQGMAAQQVAQSPKVRETDLAKAAQISQPRMEQGIAGMPVGGIGEIGNYTGAGGGIVAFDGGGSVAGKQLSLFPELASEAAAAVPESRRASFTNALRKMFGLRGSAIGAGLYPLYELHSTGMDYDTGMGYGSPEEQMTVGTVLQEPRERPVDKAKAAKPTKTEKTTEQAAADTSAPPAEKGIASLVAPKLPVPPELTAGQSAEERLAHYKAMGVSEDPFAEARKMIEADRATDAEARREAGWWRTLEAGLGTLGGESPYALVNLGKGSQAAAKGAAEDAKEFRRLERERKKEEGRLAFDQNAYLKSGADTDLARVEKRRDKIADIGLEQAKLDAQVQLKSMELTATKGDRRMNNALEAAQRDWKNIPDHQKYDKDESTFIRDRAMQYLKAFESGSFATAAAAQPRGKVVNGVYVPAKS